MIFFIYANAVDSPDVAKLRRDSSGLQAGRGRAGYELSIRLFLARTRLVSIDWVDHSRSSGGVIPHRGVGKDFQPFRADRRKKWEDSRTRGRAARKIAELENPTPSKASDYRPIVRGVDWGGKSGLIVSSLTWLLCRHSRCEPGRSSEREGRLSERSIGIQCHSDRSAIEQTPRASCLITPESKEKRKEKRKTERNKSAFTWIGRSIDPPI